MTYKEIQAEVIAHYNIDICDGTKCKNDWSRTHAHPREKRVCKWKQANSIESTFELLHEIGHILNNTSKMRRCEEEYFATVWAIEVLHKYGIAHKLSDKTKNLYQDYILSERARGVRRGGTGYPTKQELLLPWGKK